MATIRFLYFDILTGYQPSLHQGLATLSAAVQQQGHSATLEHLRDENEIAQAADALLGSRPDLIALSFTTNQIRWVESFFAQPAGRTLASRLIVAGGIHCTLEPVGTLEAFPWLNGVCVGEGEQALTELCRRIDAGEDVSGTPCFVFRTPGGLVQNPVLPLQKMEDLPAPDYALFDYRGIISRSGDSFPMMLSRGCPYDCHYCCNKAQAEVYPDKGPPYTRFLPVPAAIARVERNLELFPETKVIAFADDTFTLNRNWLVEFCDAYRRAIGLPFVCNARVETIRDEVVQALKHGGCASVDFGVESGNEWLRREVLNRRYSNAELLRAFQLVQAAGIRCFSFNLVGIPFETEAMARQTVEINLELRPYYGKCSYFYPYPATQAQALCAEHGLTLERSRDYSGYFDGPALDETHMSHKTARRYFDRINAYMYLRLVLSRVRAPHLLEKLVFRAMVVSGLDRLLMRLLTQAPRGRRVRLLRRFLRSLAVRALRPA